MKKFVTTLLFALLALAPFSSACDASFPKGVQGALTINIPSCEADNYTAPNAFSGCGDIRNSAVAYLNSISASGTTFTYVQDKNQANFIVYIISHEVSADVFIITLKTYGMGLTADGHTLFSVVGKEGDVGDSALDAYTRFASFINNGWTCP